MKVVRWRKSSYSGGNTQSGCVELAHSLDAVRDSKNPLGAALSVDVQLLLTYARSGQLGPK
ncbi:MAG TPA: DUF397 domain-containing protein [Pseudonocardiaceae bacterium]|nr:DUF397 domain-containing protein [Pseudonocardiaceae bacterium]